MARYIKTYANTNAIKADLKDDVLVKPYVAYNEELQAVDFNTIEKPIDYSKMYFTIEALEDGDIIWRSYFNWFFYRKNGGNWVTAATSSEQKNNTISVLAGDKIEIRGTADRDNQFSATTCTVNIYGNVNSIRLNDNFTGDTTSVPISGLFIYNTKIVSAENLVLPATAMTQDCYMRMFRGCTSLTKAPSILPATSLSLRCYKEMFSGCTSLVSAPELPAGVVQDNAYENMFIGCTSLEKAPELLAGTLKSSAYSGMFSGCTSLNYVKCMIYQYPQSDTSMFTNWLSGVSATGTFVKRAGVSWPTGNKGIPSGWTVVEE